MSWNVNLPQGVATVRQPLLSNRVLELVDPQVAALGPAQFVQPLQECSAWGLADRVISGPGVERADPPTALGLLCVRHERPCGRRTTEKRNEIAPLHVPPVRTTPCAMLNYYFDQGQCPL